MVRDSRPSRRKVITTTGAVVATALVAGCGGNSEEENGGNGNGEENGGNGNETGGNGNETDGDNGNETDGGNGNETDGDNGNETDGGNGNETDGGNGDETDGDNGDGAEAISIEPETAIEFSGSMGGWTGIAPSSIEGETNPTLSLQEGETYEIGWTEGDGMGHNIEIRNDSDEVVNDLSTEITADPGDGQWLEFEATSEMAQYLCNPHQSSMVGSIQVE